MIGACGAGFVDTAGVASGVVVFVSLAGAGASLFEALLKFAKASMSRASESTRRSMRAKSLGFVVGLSIEAVVRPINEFAIAARVDSGETAVAEVGVVVAVADGGYVGAEAKVTGVVIGSLR